MIAGPMVFQYLAGAGDPGALHPRARYTCMGCRSGRNLGEGPGEAAIFGDDGAGGGGRTVLRPRQPRPGEPLRRVTA